jgi:DNA-binding MarR family transcriptional regulator
MTQPDARIADRLHSAAIHLLRFVRREDVASGLSAPRLSALSVIVFGGPIYVSDLAAAEGVQRPTMTRLVQALEAEGLVTRVEETSDRRKASLVATAKGERLLIAGRERRVAALTRRLAKLSSDDKATLARAAELLDGLARSST